MNKLILAGCVLAFGALSAGTASAQRFDGPRPPVRDAGPRWEGGHGAPPPGAWRYSQSYGWCTEKARRLHDFEFRMTRDGRVSRDERRIAENLRADLSRSCGGGRWHPDRGWHY